MSARGRAWRCFGALVACALGSVAVACTGGDDGAPPTTAPPQGGTLRIALAALESFDPAALNPGSPTDMLVADLLYDSLTARGADGETVAAIADEWSADDDLEVWTFTLREGVTFADGTPITAADVKRSLEHVVAAGDGSFASFRLDAISGFGALSSGEARGLSGVEAVDEGTLRITLSRPVSTLPEILASPLFGVTAPSVGEAGAPPVPSGQFEVASASPEVLELRALDDSVAVDGVELRFYENRTAAYDAFDRGEADVAPVPERRLERALAAHDTDAFVPFHAEVFLGVNLQNRALRSRSLRRAIALSIDRDAIIDRAFTATAETLRTVVPIGIAGHRDDACGDVCERDVDEAKDLLEEEYGDGKVPTVLVDVDDRSTQVEMARQIVADLKEAGIPAKVRRHPFGEYTRFAISGRQQLFSFGWIGIYDSPDAFLTPLFTKGGADNVTGYANEDVLELLRDARRSDDAGERSDAWADVERQVLESAVIIPIAQYRVQLVASDAVQNLVPRTDGTLDWTLVALSP